MHHYVGFSQIGSHIYIIFVSSMCVHSCVCSRAGTRPSSISKIQRIKQPLKKRKIILQNFVMYVLTTTQNYIVMRNYK